MVLQRRVVPILILAVLFIPLAVSAQTMGMNTSTNASEWTMVNYDQVMSRSGY